MMCLCGEGDEFERSIPEVCPCIDGRVAAGRFDAGLVTGKVSVAP